jgi:hypothetical protein
MGVEGFPCGCDLCVGRAGDRLGGRDSFSAEARAISMRVGDVLVRCRCGTDPVISNSFAPSACVQ